MTGLLRVDQHTRGLRFRKLDLHVHTPASKDFAERSITPEALVQEALKKGLEAIAVTDHNSGAAVDDVKAAGKDRGLTVFPGVEITCSGGKEGVHIVAIFDPSCSRAHVEGLLSALGLRPEQYGDMKAVVNKNPIEVVETIHGRCALAVLAHVNSSRGVFHDMKGQQRTNLIQHPFVAAAEATDFQNAGLKKDRKRAVDLLDGTDPEYRRKLAVYQASDNPSGQRDGEHGLAGIGSRSAYFKMDRIDLDALRQCFADPDVRIRQDFEYRTQTYPFIKSIRVTGGFLDHSEASFHEGLNSILGAKGAGKSLLVEFMRFALDQPPTNEEILDDHGGKLRERLLDYGVVDVTIMDETGKELSFKRTYDPAEGNPYEAPGREDVAQLFPVLFLSQNEIIRIAESEEEQIAFIDRFFDFRSYQSDITLLERQLSTLDGDLAESMRASRELKEIEKRMRVRSADLEKLDRALKNPVFDDYAKLETKDRTLRDQRAHLQNAVGRLDRSSGELVGPTPPVPTDALAEDPAVRRAVERSAKARELISQALDTVRAEIGGLVAKGEEEYQRWHASFQEGRKRYEEAIQKEGGDYKALAQQRAKAVKELESLQERVRTLKEVADRLETIRGSRKARLTELHNAYEKYTAERKARCERIEAESSGRLKVRIHEASNVDEFRDHLASLKKGSHVRDADIERIATKVGPGDFIQAIIKYSLSGNEAHLGDLANKTEIGTTRIQALADFLTEEGRYETLLALEYKAIPQDRPEIRYNLGDDNYQLLEQLSVGQKCTAMLIIALSEGTMPIVIDQPEDSLDLRTIWEDICTKVRRGKERRQFIFTTHNSSVAVASDSDKFIIMEADAGGGKVVFSGSMDHQPVSAEALKYLEGGEQTYRTKYRKYRGDAIVG